MSKQSNRAGREVRVRALAAAFCLAAMMAAAQQPAATAPSPVANSNAQNTSEQTRQLVDQQIKFSSEESGLPIKSEVKRQTISRGAVESYLKEKMEEDQSAKRMQRDEIVLKKFGLIDRDFDLKPFLLSLLKEQIEAYYDSKTKTVFLLDWVKIEEQKPVLAHELTHALQDQHIDLESWRDQTPRDISLNSSGDTVHLLKDEMDSARLAVVEGQATAVQMDYMLKPLGKSLVKNPEVMELVKQQMTASQDSPILARAPLLLTESLLFPYREGLSFEQDLWMDLGQTAAFAGTLDRPPTSSWEILNPREYEKRHMPAVPLLPNIHPLVDKLYKPYDIGQIGQLDLHILVELFGGEQADRDLTPAWNGGMYWAGQRLDAKTPAEQASTNSLALFYLSAWKNAASARSFARIYAEELGRKYSEVKLDSASNPAAPAGRSSGFKVFPPPAGSAETNSTSSDQEQVYSTSEGSVVITVRGKLVFIAESFPLEVARKLTALVLDAQGSGEMKLAGRAADVPAYDSESREPLTGNLIRFISNCGVMKAAAGAAVRTGR